MKYIKRFFNFLWNEIPSRFSTIFGVLYVFFYLWFFRPFNNELWHDKSGAGIAIVIIIIGSALPTAIVAICTIVLFIFEKKQQPKKNIITKNALYKLFVITIFIIFIITGVFAIILSLVAIYNNGFIETLRMSFEIISGIINNPSYFFK